MLIILNFIKPGFVSVSPISEIIITGHLVQGGDTSLVPFLDHIASGESVVRGVGSGRKSGVAERRRGVTVGSRGSNELGSRSGSNVRSGGHKRSSHGMVHGVGVVRGGVRGHDSGRGQRSCQRNDSGVDRHGGEGADGQADLRKKEEDFILLDLKNVPNLTATTYHNIGRHDAWGVLVLKFRLELT